MYVLSYVRTSHLIEGKSRSPTNSWTPSSCSVLQKRGVATEYIINPLVKAYPRSHTTPITRCWFQTYFCSPLFGNHSHFDSYFTIGLKPPNLGTPLKFNIDTYI